MGFNRPCIVCGTLTREGSRCTDHKLPERRSQKSTEQRKEKKANLYNSRYRKLAKAVRDTAQYCHICQQPARPNDPWEADHLIPGDPNSPLAAAHRSCNGRRGNRPII